MKKALIYSLKIWSTTVIAGSIVMGLNIYVFLSDRSADALRNLYIVPEGGIPYGVVYFLPSWLVFGIATWYVLKKRTVIKLAKGYLSIVSVILAIAPFATIDYRSLFVIHRGWFAAFPPNLFWTVTYAGLTLAGTWFYELKPNNILLADKTLTVS